MESILNSQFNCQLILNGFKTVFELLLDLDLKTKNVNLLFCRDQYKSFMRTSMPYAEYKEYYINHRVLPFYHQAFLEFMDERTAIDRLRDNKNQTLEYEVENQGWIRTTFMPSYYDEAGNVSHILISERSISIQMERRLMMTYLSETDSLTGISNRYRGVKRMQDVCARHIEGVFCYIDIDHFKLVNDRCGHTVGDELLVAVAHCLNTVFPGEIVYRIGGDEFGFYLTGPHNIEQIEKISKKLFDAFDQIQIKGIDPAVRKLLALSVGAVQYNGDKDVTVDDILIVADKRMYESKKIQGNYVTFIPHEHTDIKSIVKEYKERQFV